MPGLRDLNLWTEQITADPAPGLSLTSLGENRSHLATPCNAA